jgi:methylglutaconyl-CoA hydratase
MSLIEVVREGPVARVWFNRPDAHNAIGYDLGAELVAALAALEREADVRVVVLGGRGPSFCAGADIGAMRAMAGASFEQNLADAEKLAGIFAAVAEFPRPVVGRIHGNVLGGGVGFVCACDIAVAADDARFGLTEVRLGIIPGIISPYVIRRLGDRAAREFMLTGERFDAAAALRVGLVHHVVPAGQLDAKIEERVGELLKGGPDAQHRIKQVLERWGNSTWKDYVASLPRTLAEVRSGDEARDGLGAFIEKRKPRWLAQG